MRICSLLPSATEIVYALGGGRNLVAVTHECDYPADATLVRRVTSSKIQNAISGGQIDAAVSSTLNAAGSLYDLDMAALEELQPDLVLSQKLCRVCAASFEDVNQAVQSLRSRPRVLFLEPHSLADILTSIRIVGQAIGRDSQAYTLVKSLQARIEAVRHKTCGLSYRPRVVCLEWVDPPFCGGHWMKELVEIGGGRDDLSNSHRPSTRIEWRRVMQFAPEVIVLTCCGFALDRCTQEGRVLEKFERLRDLPAARFGRIFATDGSAYFSRPGPRIVDSLEILAHLIHPDLFQAPALGEVFSRLDISGVVTAQP